MISMYDSKVYGEGMRERLQSWLSPWGNWRRKRFWLLAALLAWTLFGFFGAPPLVERAMTQSIEATGRDLAVDDVRTNPFVLSLAIDGLAIRDPDGTAIARFGRLYVNFQLSSIFRRAWTFAEIHLLGLHLEEERFAAGDTRILRLVNDLFNTPAEPQPAPEEEAPPRLIILELVIADGSAGFTDRLAGDFHGQFGPIEMTARNIRTTPDHAGDQEVSIGTPGGGVISWRGDLGLVPLSSTGQLTVRGEGLPAILRYADHFLPVELEGSELDMSLDYMLKARADGLSIAARNWNVRTGGLSVRMDGSDEAFLDLQEITLEGGRFNWPEKTVHAESLALQGLDLEVWLDEQGHLSLLDALPPESDGAAAEPGWGISLGRLALGAASVEFQDRRLPEPGVLEVEGLSVALSSVDNREGTEIPTQLSLSLASGGTVSFEGTVVALPEVRLDGHTSVSRLSLPVLQPWLAQEAKLELTAGMAALEADIEGRPEVGLRLGGSVTLSGVELQDTRRNQRLAALESLDMERFELDLADNTLEASPVELQGAYGRIHIFEDQSTNLDGLMVEDEEQGEAASEVGIRADGEPPGEREEESLSVAIGGIEVESAAVDFADDSLPLPFQVEIRSVDGSVATLATASAEPASVELEGRVSEFGEARIRGSVSPWEFTRNTDITMVFRNLQMSNLTPYVVEYAGYAIEGGRLDMDLHYTLDGGKLVGENSIVIDELVLGDKVEHPDAASLPLKLAVALLKDSEGVIDVDLPVSGDLNDPTFKISGIVWKAIGNLITRVVTSPFRFLGGLVGVDSEDFGALSFRPGRANVSPSDREQLIKLAEAMGQRPELGLVADGIYVEELDRPALKARAFETRFEAVRDALLQAGEAEPIAAERDTLEKMFGESFPGVPLEAIQSDYMHMPAGVEGTPEGGAVLDEPAYLSALRQRLIDAEEIGEEALRELGRARAETVVQTLQSAAEGQPIAASFSGTVESGEADEGSVILELEVAVQEAASKTEDTPER